MNCLAVECDGRIAVVDCGVMFPNEPIGVDVIVPDLSWLIARKAQVGAIYVTHGHEDHIGALAQLLAAVKAPVHAPRFARALVEARLREAGVQADLREVQPGEVRGTGEGGAISAEFVAVTHSIPDACALALRTPQGVLLHSGDFKIDEAPVSGRGFDLARMAALGKDGVRLLLSDSTNAERPGTSLSESQVGPALDAAFESARGRVFVACFASNIHRIQQVADVARALGRRLVLLGRSMEQNVRLAQELGYLDVAGWQLCALDEARALPPRELCVLTTGTQGEPRAALARLARGEHPELSVSPGDLVVLSSRHIPGNEIAIGEVVNGLARRGAEVAYEDLRPLHVSGHAQEAEQRRLIQLVRPERFVPIHGEFRHLARHARHAELEQVPHRHLLVDGEVLEASCSCASTGRAGPWSAAPSSSPAGWPAWPGASHRCAARRCAPSRSSHPEHVRRCPRWRRRCARPSGAGSAARAAAGRRCCQWCWSYREVVFPFALSVGRQAAVEARRHGGVTCPASTSSPS